MDPVPQITRHARHRAEQRAVPGPVIGLILDYRECRDAGGGVQKYALSKSSLRTLRRDIGTHTPRDLERYRKVYIVASLSHIITAAFARRHLFH